MHPRFFLAVAALLIWSVQVCAEPDIIIQNKTYDSGQVMVEWSEYTIETQGSVTVEAGANVSFITGEAILLGPGFTIELGSLFSAKIQGTPPYNPGGYYTASPLISLMGGGNQFGLINTFTLQPFDVVVWNTTGTAPLVNAPVLVTIDSGGGWLSATNTVGASLSKTLALMSDSDGAILFYYKHGSLAYEKATIRIVAGSRYFFINAFSVGSGDLDGDGILDINEAGIGDLDGDFMPDMWEVQYALNPYVNGSSQDADGDGVYDILEFFQGRNPTKAALPDVNDFIKLRVYSPSL